MTFYNPFDDPKYCGYCKCSPCQCDGHGNFGDQENVGWAGKDMPDIVTQKRRHDWKASRGGNSRIWEAGATEEEAIRKLHVSLGEEDQEEEGPLTNEDGTPYASSHERHPRTDYRSPERAWRPQRPRC